MLFSRSGFRLCSGLGGLCVGCHRVCGACRLLHSRCGKRHCGGLGAGRRRHCSALGCCSRGCRRRCSHLHCAFRGNRFGKCIHKDSSAFLHKLLLIAAAHLRNRKCNDRILLLAGQGFKGIRCFILIEVCSAGHHAGADEFLLKFRIGQGEHISVSEIRNCKQLNADLAVGAREGNRAGAVLRDRVSLQVGDSQIKGTGSDLTGRECRLAAVILRFNHNGIQRVGIQFRSRIEHGIRADSGAVDPDSIRICGTVKGTHALHGSDLRNAPVYGYIQLLRFGCRSIPLDGEISPADAALSDIADRRLAGSSDLELCKMVGVSRYFLIGRDQKYGIQGILLETGECSGIGIIRHRLQICRRVFLVI